MAEEKSQVATIVLDEGKYKGRTLGDLGSTYLGYGYIKYKAGEGEAPFMEYILTYPEQPLVTWEECKSYVMPFGKHKGLTLMELAKTMEGQSYLQYISTWEKMSEREVVKMMVLALPKLPPPTLDLTDWQMWEMPFGKFKGENMLHVSVHNAGYLQYMAKQMKKKPNAQNNYLRAKIEHILNPLA